MKKRLLMVIVLLLLVGGGAGGWFYMQGGEEPVEGEAEPEEPAGPPVYVEFDPIRVPLVGDERIEQFVTIQVVVEVADKETGDIVISQAPRLNDTFLESLYGSLHVEDALPNGALNVPLIKNRLIEQSRALLGEEVVRDVLVQMIDQRYL